MASKIPYKDNSEVTLVTAEAFKALVDRVNVISSPKFIGGTWTLSDNNLVIKVDAPAGGGVPAGYVETAISICIDGVETPGKILFKPD